MLVDLISFSGELPMLVAHLKHVQADLTIVYESDRSFTGIPKSLTDISFLCNEKVIYYPIKGCVDSNPWVNEYAQRRDAFAFMLSQDLPDDAIVMITDVDEFPDMSQIIDHSAVTVWMMNKYQMSASWFQKKELSSMSGSVANLRNWDVVDVIKSRSMLPSVDGGWHFSSFLTLEDLQTKWRNFSHQELVRENMDDWVAHCWVHGKAVENGVPMIESIDYSDLPAAILEGPDYWFRVRP